MFKKPITLSSTHKVSGGDRKKLKRNLLKAFPEATEDDISAFLPNKDGDLSLGKVQSSRMHIYLLDNEPIIVDPSGKGDFFPSVYALWKAPGLLPTVTVKHPAVTKFLVGGADLMLPGVDDAAGIPEVQKGAMCAVLAPGNPAPLAVGEVGIASSDVYMAGGRGRFLMAVHHYRDCLWSLPDHKGVVPNEGYYINGVGPTGGAEQDIDGQLDGADSESEGGDASPGPGMADEAQEGVASLSLGPSSAEESPQLAEEPAEDMDSLVGRVFLQVLHLHLEDSQLPVPGGKLWSDFILPNRPPGAHLDLKKTSFKKLSKFLKSRKDMGLISCKEDKQHSNETMLTKINRTHKIYTGFQTYDQSAEAASAPADEAPQPIEVVISGAGVSDTASAEFAPLSIEEVFTTGSQKEVGIVFAAVVGPGYKNESYRAPQVHDIVQKYIEDNKLEQDGGQIMLDPYLCDALFKGVLKKGDAFPTHLPKCDVADAFLKRILPQQRLSRGPLQVLKKGNLPQVTMQAKTRSGNKKVTCVQGLEPFLIDAQRFALYAQRKCACAASCSELEGSKNKNCFEVIIQGDKTVQIISILTNDYAVPSKYIQGADSVSKKKKK